MMMVKVGDAVPVSPRSGIFEPGAARWYALRVMPQREDQAEAWLHLRGVYGFHPVLERVVRRHGVARVYQRRYLPGYVFARFDGVPLQHLVLQCPWIIGALCASGGHWGVLDPHRLSAIHAMRKLDERQSIARAQRRARKMAASRIRAGEAALFSAGPFAGIECEVVELQANGGAIVRLDIFGRVTSITAGAAELKPLRKDS